MKKMNYNKIVIPSVYILGITVFALCLVAIAKGIKDYSKDVELDRLQTVFNEQDNNYEKEQESNNETIIQNDNVNTIVEETTPVIASTNIIKPYKDKSVKLSRSYYDKDSDEKTQENSIIFYGNTYMQNLGSEYSSSKEFDVLSVIDGTISNVTKDDTTLYTVEIKHDNDLVTIYEYLDSVNISAGDSIKKGDKIGVSGKSIVNNNDNYTLHFEVYHKGLSINPENLYTMKVEDFN